MRDLVLGVTSMLGNSEFKEMLPSFIQYAAIVLVEAGYNMLAETLNSYTSF